MAESGKKFRFIMLVDDNDIDNLINQKIIEASNICDGIYLHSNVKSAIEFLKNIEKISRLYPHIQLLPDLIFLDLDMPIMDGFQFLDQFDKLSAETKQHCQIIMLTSSVNPQDASKAKNHKYIKKYLRKPLTQEEIFNLVR